jgi:type IX secretion system PorP/SprF family membrane protein
MVNNLLLKVTILLIAGVGVVQIGIAQNEMLYSNSIVGDEFLNPAFNSINGFPTIGIMEFQQWGNSVDGAPKSMAVTSFAPVGKLGLGLGINIVGERIGLRRNTLINANISQKVRLANNSLLSLGVGFGIQRNEFDEKKIITQYGPQVLHDFNYDKTFNQLSVGIVFRQGWYYCGMSSNVLLKKSLKSKLLPGIDLTSGAILKYGNFSVLPRIGYSYYQIKEKVEKASTIQYAKNSVRVLKTSCGLVYDDKLQISTSHWLNHSHSFALDVIIQKKMKIGYVYEIGVGDGINRYNSRGVRLSIDFSGKHRNRRYMFNPLGFTIL